METGHAPENYAPARNGPLLVFLLLITAILIITHNARESASGRHWDFQAFYLGAEMVSHGEGSRLYDFDSQAAAQMQLASMKTRTAPRGSAVRQTTASSLGDRPVTGRQVRVSRL